MGMRSALPLTMASLVAIAACCGGGGSGGTRDFSTGLVAFHYALRPGLGYCVTAGMMVRADVFGDEEGRFGVSGSRMETGQRGSDACVPSIPTGACLVVHALPPRPLEADEVKHLSDLFAHVHVDVEPPRDCESEDPCVIQSFQWTNRRDGYEIASDVFEGLCGPMLSEPDARAISDALDAALR